MGVLAFAMGSSVASFLNVVADRLPQGQSLMNPPSHCPDCNHKLAAWELVPVLSYLVLRGRCRVCGSRIPLRVPAVEAVGGVLFTYLWLEYGLTWDTLLLAVVGSFLLVVTVIDLERRLVLNTVLLVALPLGLLAAPFWSVEVRDSVWTFAPLGLAQLADALAAGLAGLAVFIVLAAAARGGMGFGDVKLAGVLGVWVGLRGLPVALMAAVVLGGLVALALLVFGRRRRKDAIPFAPFLAVGAMMALLWGETLTERYLDLIT